MPKENNLFALGNVTKRLPHRLAFLVDREKRVGAIFDATSSVITTTIVKERVEESVVSISFFYTFDINDLLYYAKV
jgi:hypothetical protein